MAPRRTTPLFATIILVVVALSSAGHASPWRDFEDALYTAYGDYRVALFQTNQKNKAATEAALSNFEAKWSALAVKHRTTPPPQYGDDPKWAETLATVDNILAQAKSETAAGDLPKAHETLEAIRDQLGHLRARNGIITFSDRMNAYHAKMEHMLQPSYLGFGAAGLPTVREDTAVLAHLAEDAVRNPPKGVVENPEFKTLASALVDSIQVVKLSLQKNEAPTVEAALKALKKPYSQLFLKFG
ncbi:MAG: hypothetical protein ABL898_12095 [Hyphomicrobiaceae bacterium]